MKANLLDALDVLEVLSNYVIAADEVFDCEFDPGTSLIMRYAVFYRCRFTHMYLWNYLRLISGLNQGDSNQRVLAALIETGYISKKEAGCLREEIRIAAEIENCGYEQSEADSQLLLDHINDLLGKLIEFVLAESKKYCRWEKEL